MFPRVERSKQATLHDQHFELGTIVNRARRHICSLFILAIFNGMLVGICVGVDTLICAHDFLANTFMFNTYYDETFVYLFSCVLDSRGRVELPACLPFTNLHIYAISA